MNPPASSVPLPLHFHTATALSSPLSIGLWLLSSLTLLTAARLLGIAAEPWAGAWAEAILCLIIARACTTAAFPPKGTSHGIIGFFPALIIGEAPAHVFALIIALNYLTGRGLTGGRGESGGGASADTITLRFIRGTSGFVSLVALAYLFARQNTTRRVLITAAKKANFSPSTLKEGLGWIRAFVCAVPPLFWAAAHGARRTRGIVFATNVPRFTVPGGGSGSGAGAGAGFKASTTTATTATSTTTGRSAPLPIATPINLTMDLLLPPPNTPHLGGICYVHGGGWVTGSREVASLPLLAALTARGFTVATIDYRLAPRVGANEQVADVKAAVLALRALLPQGSLIALAGESAGAHLSSLAAVGGGSEHDDDDDDNTNTNNNNNNNNKNHNNNNKNNSTRRTKPIVDAVIALCGIFDFSDSGGVWAARSGGGAHLFFRFIERFVLREYVNKGPGGARALLRASPFWRVLGPALPEIASRACLDIIGTTNPPPTPPTLSPSTPRSPCEPVIVRDNTRARGHLMGLGAIFHFFAPVKSEKSESTAVSTFFPTKKAALSDPTTAAATTLNNGGGTMAGSGATGIAAASTVAFLNLSDTPLPPPFCLIHGAKDSVVPVEESLRFMAALDARRRFGGSGGSGGVCDAIAILEGAAHAHTYLPSMRTFAVADFITDWLVALAKKA